MDATTQEQLAATIDAGSDVDARRRFWLTHMFLGFGVFLTETGVVMGYLALTPAGPHRTLLWWIAGSWLVSAAVGLALAPVVASRPWRSVYSVTWTVAAAYAVGLVAMLDHGVTSPILLLLFLPLVFGTLMFTLRSVVLCGVSALVSLSVVAAVDPGRTAAQGRTFMLFATLAGAAALAAIAAVNRGRVERHEASLRAALAELASTDELTGCAVRRVLRQRTDQEIERALRNGSPLSLLMIDVDRFKAVNDSFGHLVGDHVLATIGRILLADVRTFDVACRLGGDEFALLLPETDVTGAVHVAERIVRDLAGDGTAAVTLSIGVSSLDRLHPTAECLVDEADLALYQVKQAGRDAIAVRTPEVPAPLTW